MYNYHSHTHFCDGTNAPEDYVQAAIRAGMKVYGFSSHIPLKQGKSDWNMPQERFKEYIDEIYRLKEKYKEEIEILCGLEGDYLYGFKLRNELRADHPQIDYVVGSIHYLHPPDADVLWEIDGSLEKFNSGLNLYFSGNVRNAVEAYFRLSCEMLNHERPEILGHADKIKIHRLFDENETWYKNAWKALLDVAAETGTVLEINTRGLYTGRCEDFYPSKEIIREAIQLGIPIQLSSDAHQPAEIMANFSYAAEFLRFAGLKSLRIIKNGSWQDVELFG